MLINQYFLKSVRQLKLLKMLLPLISPIHAVVRFYVIYKVILSYIDFFSNTSVSIAQQCFNL